MPCVAFHRGTLLRRLRSVPSVCAHPLTAVSACHVLHSAGERPWRSSKRGRRGSVGRCTAGPLRRCYGGIVDQRAAPKTTMVKCTSDNCECAARKRLTPSCISALCHSRSTVVDSGRQFDSLVDSFDSFDSQGSGTHRYPLSAPFNREAHPVPCARAAVGPQRTEQEMKVLSGLCIIPTWD